MELGQAIDHFLLDLEERRNFSLHTVRCYRGDLLGFFAFLEGQKRQTSLPRLDKFAVRAYLADLQRGELSKKTRVRRLASLRSFFRYALAQILPSTRPSRLPPSKSKKEFRLPLPTPKSSGSSPAPIPLPILACAIGA